MTGPYRSHLVKVTVFALVTGLLGASVAAQDGGAAPPKPVRVLFVGNSQVYYNDLPRIIEALAESAPEKRPDLYDKDKAHPGFKGSYLYACTLYPILTGYSPVGLTNRVPKQPEDAIPAAEARRFQEAAWRIHQEVNGKQSDPRP